MGEYVPLWVAAPNILTFVGFLLTVLDFVLLSIYDYEFYVASSPVTNLNETEKVRIENGQSDVIPHYVWILLAVFLFVAYTLEFSSSADGIDGKQALRTQTSGPLGELFDHGLDSYSVFFIPVCLYSVFGRADFSLPPIRSYKLRTGKMRSFTECIRPLWSLFAVFGMTTVWVMKSPNNIVEYDPRMVFLLLGTLFSNIACRLIVSQMSNQRCEAVPWIQWPLTFATGLSIFCPHYEIMTLYIFTTLVILAHVHYGTCVKSILDACMQPASDPRICLSATNLYPKIEY
ncbi:Ethanolaminephosphotransferase 1 [Eumeta japonica]|uniref:Ethanolaminephosphotransferase 1 n=1 Tax=Eumeta variegata TaxID=151549 RepID=A0A4C1U3C6_EUMVA|nr:Ethanolaminephosphotransferase 1 [Eumeta japonica]